MNDKTSNFKIEVFDSFNFCVSFGVEVNSNIVACFACCVNLYILVLKCELMWFVWVGIYILIKREYKIVCVLGKRQKTTQNELFLSMFCDIYCISAFLQWYNL